MTKIKVLIAGCGYLGEHLSKVLCDNQYMVYTLKRTAHKIECAHPIQMDLGQLAIQDLPEVDVIFYTAAPIAETEEAFEHTYITYLENLLKAYEKKPPKRFILCSSTAVYGRGNGQWIDETSPRSDETFRSRVLSQAEVMIENSGFDYIIARISGIYGQNRHLLLDQIKAGHFFASADTIFSNRVHIEDCARALEHLMRITRNQYIYNITDQHPAPINTLLSWLSTKFGIPFPSLEEINQTQETLYISNKQVSCERLLTTGYQLKFPSFREGYNQIMKAESPPRELDY